MDDFNKQFFGTLGIVKDLAEGNFKDAYNNAYELYYEHPASTGVIAEQPPVTEQPATEQPAPSTAEMLTIRPSFTSPPIKWDEYQTVVPISDDGKKYVVGLQHKPVKTGINPTFI